MLGLAIVRHMEIALWRYLRKARSVTWISTSRLEEEAKSARPSNFLLNFDRAYQAVYPVLWPQPSDALILSGNAVDVGGAGPHMHAKESLLLEWMPRYKRIALVQMCSGRYEAHPEHRELRGPGKNQEGGSARGRSQV